MTTNGYANVVLGMTFGRESLLSIVLTKLVYPQGRKTTFDETFIVLDTLNSAKVAKCSRARIEMSKRK